MTYKGTTALITGASVGRGEEFAPHLAQKGADLVLVARSEEKLERLANELREHAGVEVTVIPADLSSSDAVSHLVSEVRNRRLKINLLVNNAGLGVFENFLDTFVLFFREALSLELEKTGVRVLVACPGPVVTTFHNDAD